jgi:molybdate transport system ATP-binding protein
MPEATGGAALHSTVVVERDGFALDASLDAAAGETVAVLGPNGAGKTTLLSVLAGLLPLDRGSLTLDGTVLDDPGAGTFVRPEHRPVGVMFQHGLLFPHLSALDNVAFGPQSRGVRKAEARRLATEWLERVGLAHRMAARSAALSGGEAQRVALARALVTSPALLLLDEPMSALDVGVRAEVRREVQRHLASFAGVRVVVTHDPLEAAALADRLVVLEEGKVVQTGTPAELAARPRTQYVATLAGTNLFRGFARGHEIEIAHGGLVSAAAAEGPVLAVVHPRAVALSVVHPEGSPRNVWPGVVDGVDVIDDRCRVRVGGAVPVVAEVTPGAVDALELVVGRPVWVSVKATELDVYPA